LIGKNTVKGPVCVSKLPKLLALRSRAKRVVWFKVMAKFKAFKVGIVITSLITWIIPFDAPILGEIIFFPFENTPGTMF